MILLSIMCTYCVCEVVSMPETETPNQLTPDVIRQIVSEQFKTDVCKNCNAKKELQELHRTYDIGLEQAKKDTRTEYILKMHLQGINQDIIAKVVGVSRMTVSRYLVLNNYGLTRGK